MEILSQWDENLISLIIGGLLGDTLARKGFNNLKGEGTSFTIAHSAAAKDYLFFKYNIFKKYNLCTDRVPTLEKFKIRNRTTEYSKYVFYTSRVKDFDIIFDAFYKDIGGTYLKGLYNQNLISHYLTPLALAV